MGLKMFPHRVGLQWGQPCRMTAEPWNECSQAGGYCVPTSVLYQINAWDMAGSSVYDFTMDSLEGKPIPLKAYKRKVLLIVNVATF
uniref:Glutathione peroxidase n=1 Tax=Electrophorus electricus TaxID=8005 RepID=A0A4W4EXN1_ELEEL